jgi:hypothetical protein
MSELNNMRFFGQWSVIAAQAMPGGRYQQGEEKDSYNENDRNNGLRLKNKKKMKEKRFSFYRSAFGTLPLARHISQLT